MYCVKAFHHLSVMWSLGLVLPPEYLHHSLFHSTIHEDRKGNVFRVAKQLVRKNRDVVGAGCVKDNVGKIVVEEDKLGAVCEG